MICTYVFRIWILGIESKYCFFPNKIHEIDWMNMKKKLNRKTAPLSCIQTNWQIGWIKVIKNYRCRSNDSKVQGICQKGLMAQFTVAIRLTMKNSPIQIRIRWNEPRCQLINEIQSTRQHIHKLNIRKIKWKTIEQSVTAIR